MLTELKKALEERDLAWEKYRKEYDKVLMILKIKYLRFFLIKINILKYMTNL